MRKRALAIWPNIFKEEPGRKDQPEKWVQEEEVLKLRLQENNLEQHREKLQRLTAGLDLKKLVL